VRRERYLSALQGEASDPAMTKGDRYDKWTAVVGSPDNHLFDCLNGSLVAASVDGLIWNASGEVTQAEKKKRKTFAEMEAEAKKGRA
jgi:hypothetical protein